jgi:hypothetical protein
MRKDVHHRRYKRYKRHRSTRDCTIDIVLLTYPTKFRLSPVDLVGWDCRYFLGSGSFSPQNKEMENSTGLYYDCGGTGRSGGVVGGKGIKYGSYLAVTIVTGDPVLNTEK